MLNTENRPQAKHLVLVGAGHAHLYLLSRLERLVKMGLQVTVVSPTPFWYSGMAPGLLSGEYSAFSDTVDVAAITSNRGARFLPAKIDGLDAGRRLVFTSGETIFYDFLSLNTGSQVRLSCRDAAGESIAVKPVENFLTMRQRILAHRDKKPLQLAVLGGGAAGCETAANVACLCHAQSIPAEITLFTRENRLLKGMP